MLSQPHKASAFKPNYLPPRVGIVGLGVGEKIGVKVGVGVTV